MRVESRHFRRSVIATLVISVPAMLMIGCFFGCAMVYVVLTAFPAQIAVGYLCMGVFAWLVAPRWGAAGTARLPLAGLFGVLVFLLGVVSGSLSSVFVVSDFSFRSYVVPPLFWLGCFGAVPAFVIGILGGYLCNAYEP